MMATPAVRRPGADQQRMQEVGVARLADHLVYAQCYAVDGTGPVHEGCDAVLLRHGAAIKVAKPCLCVEEALHPLGRVIVAEATPRPVKMASD